MQIGNIVSSLSKSNDYYEATPSPIEAALERGRGRDIFWIFVQCCGGHSRCSGSVGGSVPSLPVPAVFSSSFCSHAV